MAKNGMKVSGVLIMIMIMIMLSFSEANYNGVPEETRSNDVPKKLNCKVKCDLECAPFLLLPGRGSSAYVVCVNVCQAKCPPNSLDHAVEFCITGCAIRNYPHLNADVPAAAVNLVNSCVQECHNNS